MLEHLFGSKTRLRLLRLFFKSDERPFFVRELGRELSVQINAIRREIEILSNLGIIKEFIMEKKADKAAQGSSLRKYYITNKTSLIYNELYALLVKEEVMGEQKFLQEISENGGDIKLLVISGRFTGSEDAPSDILVVGEIKEKVVSSLISKYEEDFGVPVKYTFMNEREFYDRRQIMDKFLYSMLESKSLKLVNELHV